MSENPEPSAFAQSLRSDNRNHQCGILVADSGAVIRQCNDVFLQMSGLSRQEITGSSLLDFIEKQDRDRIRRIFAAQDQFSDNCGPLLLLDKRGKSLSCTFNCCALPAEKEDPLVVMTICETSREDRLRRSLATTQKTLEKTIAAHDRKLHEYTASLIDTNVDLRRKIRDHQRAAEALRASETRFRDLTETTSDFIWEIDQNGRYTYTSPKITKLLGYSPEELMGEKFLLLRNPAMAARFIREIELGPNPESGFANWHYPHTHKDGREIIIESSGEPIILKKGEISGYRGIDRDITERVHYEENLRIAKEQAESANRTKSEFLANMSHELRTPLHAILSFSRFGEKKIHTADSAELCKYFKQIETSAQRLLPLINSLLDLSKLEAGKMNYDIIHGSILDEFLTAADEISPMAAHKNVGIVIDRRYSETRVHYDRKKLSQVIRNLLSNAVKFCDDNTSITISFAITTGMNLKKHLCTTIANTGIGIPENELETIFDKFAQSSKTKTGAGGTGLGLAICRQIIRGLRGRIWAETSNSSQTLFHFTLPTYPKGEKIGQILIDKGIVSIDDLEKALLEQK
jgi:PAS domain S-box-containing protein